LRRQGSRTGGRGPIDPQLNGKVERFNLTLKHEWAYATPYTWHRIA
jgi:transposase InsO family protein